MLVSAKEMLNKAQLGKYAIGHFNITNLEWVKAVLLTAQEMNSPVILGVSEDAAKYMGGYTAITGMVEGMLTGLTITVPVALHLDHGSYENCLKAIDAGFSSIMYNGSQYPIEENLKKTAALVQICNERGISLEAEDGYTNGKNDTAGILVNEYAEPQNCKALAGLGITMLSVGIGNIHGKKPTDWNGLDFNLLESVKNVTGNLPLVLHGGTGIPPEMVRKAISLGVTKINVNTECQLAFAAAIRNYIESGKDLEGKGFDPRKLLAPGTEAIKSTVKTKIELFGSADRA